MPSYQCEIDDTNTVSGVTRFVAVVTTNCVMWRAVALAITLLGCLLAASPAAANHAANATVAECMVDRFNATKPATNTNLNCTSNDVELAIYQVVSGPATCISGEVINVVLKGDFIATSAERWDVGVFVSTDGGTPNALGGSCYQDYLHPVSADNTDINLAGGFGPFYNGEIVEDIGDTCADIEQGQNATFVTEEFPIVCQDSDNDGQADVTSCTVWANSRSDGDSKPSCNSEADVTAETTAKCTCDAVNIIGIDFLEHAFIEIVKSVTPSDDPGFFDLEIDAAAKLINAQDTDATGPVMVSAGTNLMPGDTHTVGESAGTGTSLANYTSSISCVDRGLTTFDGGPPLTANGAGPLNVGVDPNDDIVCTITNINTCSQANCSALNTQCTTFSCDLNGSVSNCDIVTNVADSTPCEDGNVCTSETGAAQTPDHCEAGSCVGVPVDCSGEDDQCNDGVCNTTSGACEADPKADSTPCEDGRDRKSVV
jgi:hypothetical protein